MTTHAPARPTDRPIPSPFTGAGKLWRATFLSHILNPWNMAFALLLPLFMYAMFGMTEAARTTQTGRGNVAAAMVVMMTTYGVILVGGSLGATLSVERTTGISRMYALTPIQPWVILLVRLTALVALSAFIALICFSVGLATGSQMTAGAWAGGAAGGIALSALGALIGLAGGTSAQLNSYLFGSISTVRWSDITLITILGVAIVALGVGLAPALFSVTNDEDFARSTGLPVRTLSLLIAILSALTVAVAMRVVGSLLVSALMVIPVAIAQLGARSFRSTMGIAMVLGVLICTCGLSLTYFIDLSPGATIVVGAIGLYAVGFMIRAVVDRVRRVRRLRVARTHNQHPEQAVAH